MFSQLLSGISLAAGSLIHLMVLLHIGCLRECNKELCVFHRIVEQPRLEGTSEGHLVQPFVEKGILDEII